VGQSGHVRRKSGGKLSATTPGIKDAEKDRRDLLTAGALVEIM